MEELKAQMQQLIAMQATMTQEMQTLHQQNATLKNEQDLMSQKLIGAERQAQASEETANQLKEKLEIESSSNRNDHEGNALVSKWAPDSFNGEHDAWKDWSLKFVSYMGNQLKGKVGRFIQKIDEDRDRYVTISAAGEETRGTASALDGALIATCQGKALTIVQRAGSGEGLEAWRLVFKI